MEFKEAKLPPDSGGIRYLNPRAARRASLPAGRIPNRPYTLSPEDAGWLIEDVWPTVYFGSERVNEIKRKVTTLPWAKQAWEAMRREADLAITAPPQVPIEPCGWRHDFYAHATAVPLVYEPEEPTRYLDPSTGKREASDPQRRAWALLTHERTFRMMRSLGVLYRATGDERYATWAAEGMRRAAEYFTHKEFQKKASPVNPLYYQSLYDAGIILLLANAYDLTRTSRAYSDADHARIRRDIFEERVPTLVVFLQKGPQLHNMACFASAAVGTAGLLLDRKDWIDRGLGPETGLRAQLLGGLPTGKGGEVDGFWREGTLFYHFYSLCTLTTLYELERQVHGTITPDLHRRFTEMFAAPIALSDQQMRLPPVGDLSAPRSVNLAVYRHLYEYAAGQLDKERFGPVLAAIYGRDKMTRTDLTALAYGPDTLPAPKLPAKSSVLPVAGIGVFRSETPKPFWLLFRAGTNHRGHDHPDRLSVLLHAHGQPISPDLGTSGYALFPLNGGYYRSTLSHNTLFVDEENQEGNATLVWRPEATIPQARGIIVSGGVTYTRTVFFDPPFVVLVDDYASEKERRFGWAYHANGTVTASGFAQNGALALHLPALPTTKAWSNLTKHRTGVITDTLSALWQVAPNLRLRLLTRSTDPFEATTAQTPGQPYADVQGLVLLRSLGTHRRFSTLLEVCENQPTASEITPQADGSVQLKQGNGASRTYRWNP